MQQMLNHTPNVLGGVDDRALPTIDPKVLISLRVPDGDHLPWFEA